MFTLLVAAGGGCAELPQWSGERTRLETELVPVLTYLFYERGHCLYSRKQATEYGALRCSRSAAASCRADALYEPLGQLVVTADTASRLAAEWAQLRSDYPDCTLSVAALLASPVYKKTSDSHNSDARAASYFSVEGNCDGLGNGSLDKLVNRSEYNLGVSARGILARQAQTLGEAACVRLLYPDETRRLLIEDLVSGSRTLYTECQYGSSAPMNNCSSEEKAAAHSFDFANAL